MSVPQPAGSNAGAGSAGAPNAQTTSAAVSQSPTLRIGVAGLGRAFTLMLPSFVADARVRLVAACDPRQEACHRFVQDFAGRIHASVESLCNDPGVDAVYIATPHEWHAEHVCMAAAAGKHVLVEKPLALTLQDCQRMQQAVAQAGVQLVVGHSHSFNAPVLETRRIIERGEFGAVRLINAQYYTDFLYRPRRPEELDSARGGGVVFSQGAHQVDIVRLLAGGLARSVRALCGNWDATRPTEGAYAALVPFENGAFASLLYNGYGYFDGDEQAGWVSELGLDKDPAAWRSGRSRLQAGTLNQQSEAAAKAARNYGGKAYVAAGGLSGANNNNGTDPVTRHHQHFGHIVVSCEAADLRPGPDGVTVYADGGRSLRRLPLSGVPRVEVLDEWLAAIAGTRAPLHDARWSLASMELCLALLASARSGTEQALQQQCAPHSVL